MTRWKGAPGWIVLAVVVIGTFVIGAGRTSGPRSAQERIDAISQRVACPRCNGESVYESQAPVSVEIRGEIERQVAAGSASDEQIIQNLEASYPGTSLVPGSTGLDAMVWILPTAAAVLAIGGAWLAVRRWRGAPPVTHRWLWLGGMVAVAGLAGWAVAANVGQRDGEGGTAAPAVTTPQTPVQRKLAEARSQLGSNPAEASRLFVEVLKADPGNVEAMTYTGWLLAQQGSHTGDQTLVKQALAVLQKAVAADAGYPDAHCFVAITAARMLTPADVPVARREAKACLDTGVDPAMRPMVEGLLASLPNAEPATG